MHLPPFKGSKACWDAVKCLQHCGWLLQQSWQQRPLLQLTFLITHPWQSIKAPPPTFLDTAIEFQKSALQGHSKMASQNTYNHQVKEFFHSVNV